MWFADADEELAEVFPFKHAQQCAGGVLDPINDVFTVLDVAIRDSLGDLALEFVIEFFRVIKVEEPLDQGERYVKRILPTHGGT